MPSEEQYDLVLKALADARRRKMLDLVKDRPRTTGELCEHFRKLDCWYCHGAFGGPRKGRLNLSKTEGSVSLELHQPSPH